MSYNNFIPTVWAKNIERDLERKLVFAEDCNRKYEGTVKKMGDTIRILGVGKPTITTTVDKDITLPDAETVEDTSVSLAIRHIAYFNTWLAILTQHRQRAILWRRSMKKAHRAQRMKWISSLPIWPWKKKLYCMQKQRNR